MPPSSTTPDPTPISTNRVTRVDPAQRGIRRNPNHAPGMPVA